MVQNKTDHIQVSAKLGSLYWYQLLGMYPGRVERVNFSSQRTSSSLTLVVGEQVVV